MTGLKPLWSDLINLLDLKGFADPSYLLYKLREIYAVLEDVHSVASMTELQEAVDSIGTGAGTIFIKSGVHVVDTPIDIDGGGSLVIYGHGENTILKPVAGINVFNVTDGMVIIEKLKLDLSNYTANTQGIIINDTSDKINVVDSITIIGNGVNGIGISLHSDNCIIKNNNISNVYYGISLNSVDNNIISNNLIDNCNYYGITSQTSNNNRYDGNICENNVYDGMLIKGNNNSVSGNKCNNNMASGIYIYGSYNTLIGNICNSNGLNGINNDQSSYGTIVGNSCNNNVASGIYIYNCTTVVITGNECNNNCEGYAFNAGGINLAPNADYCIVSGNICSNNTNTTGGVDGYGIRIQAATCDKNNINGNLLYDNDIDFLDNGTGTVIIQGGWTGWYDDGANFRVTVVDGMITAVDNSIVGGHNP